MRRLVLALLGGGGRCGSRGRGGWGQGPKEQWWYRFSNKCSSVFEV